ncbi:MAG: zinc-ribbon domain containing protein, partial [Firmicutes bacterium]|nr:zinc-ribbon domain containing protein [Bacillota bacterium]
MEDKYIACKDCGNEFLFSVSEQEFYAEKGFEN